MKAQYLTPNFSRISLIADSPINISPPRELLRPINIQSHHRLPVIQHLPLQTGHSIAPSYGDRLRYENPILNIPILDSTSRASVAGNCPAPRGVGHGPEAFIPKHDTHPRQYEYSHEGFAGVLATQHVITRARTADCLLTARRTMRNWRRRLCVCSLYTGRKSRFRIIQSDIRMTLNFGWVCVC